MSKVSLLAIYLLSATVTVQAQTVEGNTALKKITSVQLFTQLQKFAAVTNIELLTRSVNELWDSLAANQQIPFVSGDTAVFLFKGDARAISWAGDFNGWSPEAKGYAGTRAGLSNLWYVVQQFPNDARLDYKIVADGNWILDPANKHIQMSGMGPNSELRMPGYIYPEITRSDPKAVHGRLSNNFILHSNTKNLGYDVQYRVYTPAGYNKLSNLPVVYVTDGHEYADEEKGAMVNVLDNLVFRNIIRPVIAVFIDPRVPATSQTTEG